MRQRTPRSHRLVQLICLPLAHASSKMGMIDAYFSPLGVSGLSELSVAYATVPLQPGDQFVVSDARLKRMPAVRWNASIACAMLLLVDLDAGGRGDDDSQAGPLGPFVHSLWTHCRDGAVQSCRVVKPYLPPGANKPKPNRYVYLLLSHACSASLHRPKGLRWGSKFDVGLLLSSNRGPAALVPAAYNFLLVGGPSGASMSKRSMRG
ncbi:MAG: hypothetical protein SGPRY_013772 [Prymnesium sp.]